jgi:hypothetical protein
VSHRGRFSPKSAHGGMLALPCRIFWKPAGNQAITPFFRITRVRLFRRKPDGGASLQRPFLRCGGVYPNLFCALTARCVAFGHIRLLAGKAGSRPRASNSALQEYLIHMPGRRQTSQTNDGRVPAMVSNSMAPDSLRFDMKIAALQP